MLNLGYRGESCTLDLEVPEEPPSTNDELKALESQHHLTSLWLCLATRFSRKDTTFLGREVSGSLLMFAYWSLSHSDVISLGAICLSILPSFTVDLRCDALRLAFSSLAGTSRRGGGGVMVVDDCRYLTAHDDLQATEETAAKIIRLMSEALAQMSQSGIDRTGSSSRSRRHKGGHHHALLAPHSKRKPHHAHHGRNSKHAGSNASSSHSLLAALNQRLKTKSNAQRQARAQEGSASP